MLVGGFLAAGSIALAWFFGAGVTTVNTYPAPGPTPGSLLFLAFLVTSLAVGAGVIATYGSRYVMDAEMEAAPAGHDSVRSRRRIPQSAIFLGAFGAGLLLTGFALPLTPALGISHGPLPLYIQPSVMWVPATLIGAGIGALGTAIVMFAWARRSSPLSAASWWRRTGRFVAVGTVAVLAITVPCLTVPVGQSFSATLQAYPGEGGALSFTSFPQGALVRGSWQASPTVPVNFTVRGNTYNLTQVGSSGSFNFTATGTPVPLYTFMVSSRLRTTVTFTCDFSAPLWAWPPGEPGAPTNYN